MEGAQSATDVFAILRWAFVAGGAAAVIGGLVAIMAAVRRRRSWRAVVGTVVGGRDRYDPDFDGGLGTVQTALVVAWHDTDGVERRHTDSVSRTRLSVPVGREVTLYVDPADPDRASRAHFAAPAMFVVVGLVMMAMSLAL
jgi:hypothetical protein